ncbi:MAG TPA: alkaline phosphatase family protein [Candidatus Polarisedimenticolaceae bacterium]|nr:alkaline phosphatase family protein [Candidatus Polarisedimenticolaceae bacterium]
MVAPRILCIMLGAALLLLAASAAPEAPRTLVLVLDAVPYAVVAGEGLFADIGKPVPVVGTFPSSTTPAFAAMLRPLGVAPPPGYEARSFHREEDALRLDRPPWYGSFDWIEEGLSRKTMHYARPRASARREMRDALAAFQASDDPVFLVYVNSTDGLGHLHGPEETGAFLRELDAALRDLRARYAFRTVLLSDHGMGGDGEAPLANVRQDVVRALEAGGFRLRTSLDRPRDAVLVSLGIVTFFALYGTAGEEEALLGAATAVPGVELCARADGDGWVVAGRSGRARIAREGTRWSYSALEGDPLGYLPVVERLRRTPEETWFPDRAWFEATLEADFPDALHRIAGGFSLVTNPASVLCSTAPGHVFGAAAATAGARLSRGLIRWSHGALRREDTLGFMVTDVPGAGGNPGLRIDDALGWIR